MARCRVNLTSCVFGLQCRSPHESSVMDPFLTATTESRRRCDGTFRSSYFTVFPGKHHRSIRSPSGYTDETQIAWRQQTCCRLICFDIPKKETWQFLLNIQSHYPPRWIRFIHLWHNDHPKAQDTDSRAHILSGHSTISTILSPTFPKALHFDPDLCATQAFIHSPSSLVSDTTDLLPQPHRHGTVPPLRQACPLGCF